MNSTDKPKSAPGLAAIRALAERLKLVSDLTRLRVLLLLAGDELSVGSLSKATGCSMTALSRHLAFLRLAGLIEARRQSQSQIYSLTAQGRDIGRLVAVLVDP